MTDVIKIWEPISNSSQELALDTRAQHTLYHGARGPGKTAAQLMRYRRFVGLGYGRYWRGLILDREFKNLSDVVAQSQRLFPMFNDGATFLKSANEYKWVWPTGEELLLRHVKDIGDYDAFHGHEYPFMGWNELTKQPTIDLYQKFMSVNRSSFIPELHTPKIKLGLDWVYNTPDRLPLPPIPLEVFSTTNPLGPGHNWVNKKFIKCAPNGKIVRTVIKDVYNPRTGKNEDIERTQVAIFGSFKENPYLDPIWRAGIIESCQNNPNLYKAWILGDWSVSGGGAIDDVWDTRVHVISRFPIPNEWKLDRSFDWGSTAPFCVVWWAESNGEEFQYKAKKYHFPAGSLIAIAEWYGSEDIGFNRGLKMGASDVADGIKDREKILTSEHWISRKVQGGPADNQINNVNDRESETIKEKMENRGISWTESDKSKGSRKIGLQLFRDMLLNAVRGEGPGIYFMNNCEACVELIPSLPRDLDEPDDIDTDAEDHSWDSVRYRVLKGSNRIASRVPVRWAS